MDGGWLSDGQDYALLSLFILRFNNQTLECLVVAGLPEFSAEF
jgi:hypothetical protein